MATNNKITYSTELMVNFKQGEVISPQKKFQALQTSDGYSLLFSIGNDDVFYLTEQTPGTSTGWEQIDLSSQLSHVHNNAKIIAKTFAVSQNIQSGKIDIALVVTVSSADYLYLSLNNSCANASITSQSIQWTTIPYDDPGHQGMSLDIENIYIAQTSSQEYVVVDISKKTFAQPSNFLERYYIDPGKTKGRFWNNMTIGGDLDPGVSSCLGRKSGDRVDGIYTLGSINGKYELLYAPLYNPWDPNAPPTITRLNVPTGASALAAVDNGSNSTDLFVAADKSLYFFPADKQQDGSSGTLIFSNGIFDGVSKLFAYSSGNKYVIWGLNRADGIFYTSCLKENISNPSLWSYPVPILTGVDQVSPYINVVDSSNIFFAVAGNELKKAVQSPQTGIWSIQNIALKAPVSSKAQQFSSYTTRIQLTDQNDQIMANTTLYLSANTRVSVYINHLYYVLNETPIPIPTDASGCINIAEQVSDITGTQLTVSDNGGVSVSINPMDKPFNKIASLDTPDKLKSAVITSPDGSTKPLVEQSTKTTDLQQVATANTNLSKAYASANNGTRNTALLAVTAGNSYHLQGIGDTILVEVGDIFQWLESGVEHIVQLVEDAATGFWHFVVKIGEEVYQGVLDTVQKVVGAVKWIYNAIKTAIEDLIKYLEFLFEWKDITRTKEIIKNLTKLFVQNEINQIEVVKSKFDSQMQLLVKTINSWAGITDWSGLGTAATSPVNSSSNPSAGQNAPGNLLSSHFQNNSGNITQTNPPATPNPSQSPIDTLFQALKNEGKILDGFISQMEELAGQYSQMSLSDLLKRVAAILADTVLESAENVIDALFDILYEIASAALEVLDTPIHIPVVSDILEYFGVPDLSMLDLFCWIAAVPVTIAYKIANGSAPFKDDEYSTYLINATDFNDVVRAFSGTSNSRLLVASERPTAASPASISSFASVQPNAAHAVVSSSDGLISMPQGVANAVFVTGHAASGFFTLMSCFVSGFEAAEETGDNEFAIPSAILGVLSAATNGIAAVLVPKDAIENQIVSWINKVTTGSVILCKIIFSGPVQKKFGAASGIMNSLKAADGRATGAIVNSVLIIPALCCSCWHFYELSQKSSDATRSAAIIDETSNLTSYISRISYAVAVNDDEPESKAIAIGVMVAANVVTSGLQTAEAIVGA